MDIRSQGKRRAIVVTTAVGLVGVVTTVGGSAWLWNDTAGAQSAASGTVNNQRSGSDEGEHSSFSFDEEAPSPSPNTNAPQLLIPSQGGAVQGRSSGS